MWLVRMRGKGRSGELQKRGGVERMGQGGAEVAAFAGEEVLVAAIRATSAQAAGGGGDGRWMA